MSEEQDTQTKRLRTAILIVVGILALIVLSTVVTAVTLPGCTTCHSEERDRLAQDDAHAAVDCAACHVAPGVESRIRFGHAVAWGMTARLVPVDRVRVGSPVDESCFTCHSDLEGISVVEGIRMRHDTCIEGSACISCHGDVGHDGDAVWLKQPRMDRCVACHADRAVPRTCGVCHTEDVEGRIPETGPLARVHGPNWETTHGMGDARVCGTCHGSTFCSGCHGAGVPHERGFFELHGPTSNRDDARCEGCHGRTWCDSCHGIDMPHSEEFVRSHGQLTAIEIDPRCATCHTQKDCDDCHAAHIHPGGAIDSPVAPPVGGGR